jgi:Spy/CpxP family protein refolding chaperone
VSRRWLALALLLSVGVNAGILATLAVERLRNGAAPEAAEGPEDAAEPTAAVPEEPEDLEPGAVPEEPGFEPGAGPGRGPGPGPRGGPGPPPLPEVEHRLEGLADRLGLAGEERERFLDIQRRFFRETFRQRQEIHLHQRSLRQELVAPAPDRARVGEALERLSAAREELDRALIDAVLESRDLLDPPQEAEYLRFVARLRAAGEGGHPGGPPGNRFRRRP